MSIPVMILLGYAAWTLLNTRGQHWHLPLELYCYRPGLDCGMASRPSSGQRLVPACYARAYELRREPPDYTAIVVALMATGLKGSTIDHLAIAILPARIGQTLTHIVLPPTNAVTSLRFGFFCIQLACMISIGAIITADILPRA